VAPRRAHVLAERDDVHVRGAQRPQRRPQLRLRLPEPEHDARLRDQPRLRLLRARQHRQRLPERRAPVPHLRRQRLHRLHVVRVHVQPRPRHHGHHVQVAREVARQRLDEDLAPAALAALRLDARDRLGEVVRAAVRQVVAVHRRQHHVAEPPAPQRLGRVLGLVRVQRREALPRLLALARRLDRAEAAAARARVAHQHDGRRRRGLVAAAPALADVGAARLLAHRVQPEPAQVRLDGLEALGRLGRGDAGLEPRRQPRDLLLADHGRARTQGERLGGR